MPGKLAALILPLNSRFRTLTETGVTVCSRASMAAFRSLIADRQPLEAFKLQASRCSNSKSSLFDNKASEIPLHLFEWSQSSQDGTEVSNVRSVDALEARDPATVRVM